MALIRKDSSETVAASDSTVTETAAAPAVVSAPASVPAVGNGKGSFFLSTDVMKEVIASATFGTFDIISASNGTFNLSSTKKSVGTVLEFIALGEKVKQVCSPNSQEPEHKEFFATAYVGDLCMDGSSIEEKLQEAKDGGCSKAKIVEYIDVFVKITDCADKDADLIGEIVILQLAPMAKSKWSSFKNGLLMKSEMGEDIFGSAGVPTIRAIAKGEVNARRQSFTTFNFSLVK